MSSAATVAGSNAGVNASDMAAYFKASNIWHGRVKANMTMMGMLRICRAQIDSLQERAPNSVLKLRWMDLMADVINGSPTELPQKTSVTKLSR